ncbi:hypothetical protein O181_071255 [Austropuccinia psidii MF-1]|uniref:Calcineurin-like phosphoesterase domain-containing protein n=1 Tax=Austropuccinia psidii MF-1 TaxID=1389203 RepID=A0A9Q3EY39_9BASI|nr:hypothetical protein [Austropuccinia psidii MF-1]
MQRSHSSIKNDQSTIKIDHSSIDLLNSSINPSSKILNHRHHKRSRSKSRLPKSVYDIIYVYPPSFRNLLIFLSCLISLVWLSSHILIFARFNLLDKIFSSSWFAKNHLTLRKQPLIFIHSPWSAAIVWETTQNSNQKSIKLRYLNQNFTQSNLQSNSLYSNPSNLNSFQSNFIIPNIKIIQPKTSNHQNRWIHSTLLDNLISGQTYTYELYLESNSNSNKIIRSYGTYSFTWLGINHPNQNQINQLSSLSVSSNKSFSPIELFIIGNTHSSPSHLSFLIKRALKLNSYRNPIGHLFGPRNISALNLKSSPHLMIHLGNLVEDQNDLKQWQTDFWDPITFQKKISSEIPIIYARGIHDFDPTGQNLYTAGLPNVQIGEINRTRVALLKNQNNRIILPGVSIAERQYAALDSLPRDPRTRATFFAYSPHPRIRILVLDSNLIINRQAFFKSRSTLSEVSDQEHWLLWEMARPEWKEASMRIILVNQAPFVEFDDQSNWSHEKQNQLNHYIRTAYAPHFHATSSVTRMYDIPPATLVISASSVPSYSRGLLRTYLAPYFFEGGPSSQIPSSVIKQIDMDRFSDLDPHSSAHDQGVVYVVTPGGGKKLKNPPSKVENWGFYEASHIIFNQKSKSSKSSQTNFFSPLTFDMAPEFQSDQSWLDDSHENFNKHEKWSKENIKVYRLAGSQVICPTKFSQGDHHAKQYFAIDRLYWRTVDSSGKLLDRFVIEAESCRQT